MLTLLGKKTLEAEILKEALEVASGPKKGLLRSVSLPQGQAVHGACSTAGSGLFMQSAVLTAA